MRMWVQFLVLLSELRIWRCHELWCRSKMWLKSSVAVVVAVASTYISVGPLAWELLYAADVALKKKKKGHIREDHFQIYLFIFLSFLGAAPKAYGASQARD